MSLLIVGSLFLLEDTRKTIGGETAFHAFTVFHWVLQVNETNSRNDHAVRGIWKQMHAIACNSDNMW